MSFQRCSLAAFWRPIGVLALLSVASAALPVVSGGELTLKSEPIDLEPVDSKRDRRVPLRIYRCESKTARPVVLFSHGLGGSREGNPYLGHHSAITGPPKGSLPSSSNTPAVTVM